MKMKIMFEYVDINIACESVRQTTLERFLNSVQYS